MNDLDLAIVTRQRLDTEVTFHLHQLATEVVNPSSRYDMRHCSPMDFHADVMNFTVEDLRHLSPSQFHLDVQQASLLVDGHDCRQLGKSLMPEDLDPGDTLRLVFNHVINLFEPLALGDFRAADTIAALFFTSTKAASAAGSALLLLHGGYSPYPDQKIGALRDLGEFGKIEAVISAVPNLLADFEELTLARSVYSDDLASNVVDYYRRSRAMILTVARHVVDEVFHCGWLDDTCALAEAISRHWSTEQVRRPSLSERLRPRAIVRSAVRKVRLRRPPASWVSRSRIYAASPPILQALDLCDAGFRLDGRLLSCGSAILSEAGVVVPEARGNLEGWQALAQAEIGALKDQNWIR